MTCRDGVRPPHHWGCLGRRAGGLGARGLQMEGLGCAVLANELAVPHPLPSERPK